MLIVFSKIKNPDLTTFNRPKYPRILLHTPYSAQILQEAIVAFS